MEIKISKTAHACTACGAKFEHDQSVYSHVFIVDEELNREDHCAACKQAASRQQAYSAWTTQYYDPKVAEATPAEEFSPLRRLFYDSLESDSRTEQAKAFLAAQLLRRQKVFRLIKQSDEADGEVKLLLYSDRIGNRLIEVRDPSFSFNELDKARVHLMAHLRELESGEEETQASEEENASGGANHGGDATEEAKPEEDGPAGDAPDADEEVQDRYKETDDVASDDSSGAAANPLSEEAERHHVKTV